MNKVLNYIGGKDVLPSTGRFIEKADPRTGAALCQVADSGKPEMDAARRHLRWRRRLVLFRRKEHDPDAWSTLD